MYPEYYGSADAIKPNLEDVKDESESQQDVEAGQKED